MTSERLIEDEHPREECGVIGVFAPGKSQSEPSAVYDVARALPLLQHRGQESAAVGGRTYGRMNVVGGLGLVKEAIRGGKDLLGLDNTDFAIGHVRYATSLLIESDSQDEKDRINRLAIQPMYRHPREGVGFMLGLNGNCVNTEELLETLRREKPKLKESDFATDTAILTSLMAQRIASGASISQALTSVVREVSGAYSMVVWGEEEGEEKMWALRDPNGFRPLVLGALPNDGWVVASEVGALNILHAEFDREIPAGRLIEIGRDGLVERPIFEETNPTYCIFETFYLARPDQVIYNQRVRTIRIRSGEKLAMMYPVKADVVVGVPESGDDAAEGYARQSGIPKEDAFVRNRYSLDRSFLQDSQISRAAKIQSKISSVIEEYVAGRSVVVVDDSLVRSNTLTNLVKQLRDAGAREIHVRIASDEIKHPCYYGVDMPDQSQLIAAHKSVDEIATKIGADSLGYLPIEELREATGSVDRNNRPLGTQALKFCDACMTGKYPTPINN